MSNKRFRLDTRESTPRQFAQRVSSDTLSGRLRNIIHSSPLFFLCVSFVFSPLPKIHSRQPQRVSLKDDMLDSLLRSVRIIEMCVRGRIRGRKSKARKRRSRRRGFHGRIERERERTRVYLPGVKIILRLCIYMYTRKDSPSHTQSYTRNTRTHATHIHDTLARHAYALRARTRRARAQTYAYVCTIIVSRRRIKCCMLFL